MNKKWLKESDAKNKKTISNLKDEARLKERETKKMESELNRAKARLLTFNEACEETVSQNQILTPNSKNNFDA